MKSLVGKEINLKIIKLQLTHNTGAAFGLGADKAGVALGLFAIAASCLVVYYAPFITSRGWSAVFALVLGGALGNLADRAFNEPRLLRGPVTDWLVLPHWPNFNIADSCIVAAAVLAFILTLKNIAPIEVKNVA